MKLLDIELQGFRSFHDAQSFNFAALAPGLYYVTGENRLKPRLGANAIGKSTLFEAVFWCLYGKTSRNLKAAVVKGWYTKERCAVLMHVQTPQETLEILRTWNPNILEVNGTPVEQQQLEQRIGISAVAFLYSYYHAQFTQKFLDLGATDQMALYSSVAGLDYWEDAAAFASRAARALEGEIGTAREALARAQGQLEQARAEDYAKEIKAWEEERAGTIQELRGKKKALEASTKELEAELKKVAEDSKTFQKLRTDVEKLARVVGGEAQKERAAEHAFYEMKRKKEGKCPECGQQITAQHLKKELARLERAFREAQQAAAAALNEHDEAMKRMVKYRGAEVKAGEYKKDLEQAQHALEATVNAMEEVSESENPWRVKQQQATTTSKKLRAQVKEQTKQLAECEAQTASVAYWAKGFKDVRLYLMQESLAQLTLEVNESLFALGLDDWGLEFDVERETKSGGVSRGFTTLVRAPGLDQLVPWEAWSGGESQRLRIAGTAGVANLICSRLGIVGSTEFWDEPSTWLGGEGITDLLEVLANRAEQEKKAILLADHRVLSYGRFAGTVTIVKDEHGSHIQ